MSSGKRLNLDAQTLRDLEVFSDAQGGPGIFGLVDSTRTSLGRNALKARLRHPPVDGVEIISIQHALAFLRENIAVFPIDNELLVAVDRYLNSRIEVLPWVGVGSRLAAIVRVARHPDVYSELSRGTIASAKFVRRFRDFCSHALTIDPGTLLTQLLRNALAAVEDLAAFDVCESRPEAFWNVLKRDTVFRLQRIDQMRHLVSTAAEIDSLLCMARFGKELEYGVPELSEDKLVLEAEGLFHPMIENPVGNPVRLDATANVVFLTGPNMAGKTTYLKAIGIAQLLAQSGMRVPARHFVFYPVDVLFTGINTTDNLSAGVSYYLAEVRRVKQAAEYLSAGDCALMLFDEVFKGTNVIDATEATRLVVESCITINNSIFMFSSHLSELAREFEEIGVQQRSFTGEIKDGKPAYAYRLENGASDQRMGLHLLKHEGVLDLLDEATGNSVRDIAT